MNFFWLIVSPRVMRWLTRNMASAITLWPFIFLKSRELAEHEILMNHERIHLRQQLELLILPFYLIYGLEYLLGRVKGKSHLKAYEDISFEKEAYAQECEMDYLSRRKFWAWREYL